MNIKPLRTRAFFICLLSCVSSHFIFGQLVEPADSVRQDLKHGYINLGYSFTNFHASEFQMGKELGYIEPQFGVHTGIGYSFYPLSFEINYTYGSFSTTSDPYLVEGALQFHSIHGGAYLNVFPFSSRIVPEIGLGYHYILLNNEDWDLDQSYFMGDDLNNLFWAAGIKLGIIKKVSLCLKFQQSLPKYSSDASFSLTEKLKTIENSAGSSFTSISIQIKI